jgi:hypothetical protein
MGKEIAINGGDLMLLEAVHAALQKAATHLIQQNYLLILRDLGKAKADDEDDSAELPVSLTFKITGRGNKIFIVPAIEWKRTKKSGDSMDGIMLDPDQPELFEK